MACGGTCDGHDPVHRQLDETQQTVIALRGSAFKSYVERFVPPVIFAGQYLANARRNAGLFLSNDFHMDAGKRNLIGAFYQAITAQAPVPISYREIMLTARVMDAVLEQVGRVVSC